MSRGKKITKIYDNVEPALIVPDHFFCNQSSTIVVIYNEPLGEEVDGVTLMFPGDTPSSSPKRVVPRRVGSRTLIFDTPVYSASRSFVQVLPLLNLPQGEVELSSFKIGVKHPVRNVMELCLNLSSNDAVLPVLIALMVHCERENGRDQFQDPHIDRIMATLVGSRLPGASTSIKDILLPGKKWRRMTLEDLSREFRLREMEKQAYVLKTQRLRWARRKSRPTSTSSKHEGAHQYENMVTPEEDCIPPSTSSPAIHKLSHEDDPSDNVQELLKEEHTLCTALEDYDNRSDPQKLSLKAGQDVHVLRKSADGWWFGVSNDKKGMFPGRCVKSVRKVPSMRRRTSSELPDNRTGSLRRNHRRGSVDSIDRPGGQPITDDELRKHPKATYANIYISQFGKPILSSTDSESATSDSGRVEKLPTISERIRKIHGVSILPAAKPPGWQIGNGMHRAESTDTGLDRIEERPSAEPIELPRRFRLPGSRPSPILSLSPLTMHLDAPQSILGQPHNWVDDETSSNSAFEEDEDLLPPARPPPSRRPEVGTSPQKKVPILPPSRHTTIEPQQHPSSPQTRAKRGPNPVPVPRPRRIPKDQTKPNPHFEEPAYDDVTSSRPSRNRRLEQHPATTTHFDAVGDHLYDLPDHLPPRDVPRQNPVPPIGPKPRSGSGRQVHFADSSDQDRHQNFLRTHM